MLSIKDKVLFSGISDELVEILPIITRVYNFFNATCVITSAREGQHKPGSKHYSGEALDLRTFHIKPSERIQVLRALQIALGPDFDVVLEKDHIHLEFDP